MKREGPGALLGRRWIWALCAGVAFCAVGVSPAFASDEVGPVIAKACTARTGLEIDRNRLVEVVLYEAGILTDDIDKDTSLGDPKLPIVQRRLQAVWRHNVVGASPAANAALERLVGRLEQALASTSTQSAKSVGLQIDGAPAGYDWLFDPARNWTLHCLTGKEPPPTTTQFEKPVERPLFALRKAPEELGLTGDEAKKAGSAQFGFKQERVVQDNGTTKTTRTVSVDATLGVRLTPLSVVGPVYAFANYTLSRKRVDPAPVLAAGKKQSDDDTDVLETGISVSSLLLRSSSDLSLVGSGQLGYIMDFADDARRTRLRLGLTPGIPVSLGICDLGGFRDLDVGLRFRSRCGLTFEVEASHVFKAGTADFHDHGEFLGLGGKFTYDIAAPIGKDSAILGSFTYRRLPTVWGHAPDVSRVDASLKYRFYVSGPLGFDLGLTYGRGTEPKSLKEEDKLEFSAGVIF